MTVGLISGAPQFSLLTKLKHLIAIVRFTEVINGFGVLLVKTSGIFSFGCFSKIDLVLGSF